MMPLLRAILPNWKSLSAVAGESLREVPAALLASIVTSACDVVVPEMTSALCTM